MDKGSNPTFEENGNEDRKSSSINKKENLNQPSKSCCFCSFYEMDQTLKNMQKRWSMID
jgi:hypothetical protein